MAIYYHLISDAYSITDANRTVHVALQLQQAFL